MTDRIECDYLIETPVDPARAAEVMAGEQSCGTFVTLPGETAALRARAAARVDRLEEDAPVPHPSLPCVMADRGQGYRRARVTLSWPVANIGPDLPNLIATVAGRDLTEKNISTAMAIAARMLYTSRLFVAFCSASNWPPYWMK